MARHEMYGHWALSLLYHLAWLVQDDEEAEELLALADNLTAVRA